MTNLNELMKRQERIEKKLDALIDAVLNLSDKIEQSKPKVPSYVYGIKGIAQLFGCSTATAQRIKSSGVIDAAITQRKRRIIVDAPTALTLFDDSMNRNGIRKRKMKKQ